MRASLKPWWFCAVAVFLAVGCAGVFFAARPRAATPEPVPLRQGLLPDDKMTAHVDPSDFPKAVAMYEELTGRTALPSALTLLEKLDESLGGRLMRWRFIKPRARVPTGISYHRDGRWAAAEIREQLDALFAAQGLTVVPSGGRCFSLVRVPPAPLSINSSPPRPANSVPLILTGRQ